ncbi:MAG: RelA/SpoT family protein [Spirochaetia bacterium]
MKERVATFAEKLNNYSQEAKDRILDAAYWAMDQHKDQKRRSGEPYFIHPIAVAEILISLRMDPDTIIAALLHDILEDTEISRQQMRARFGKDVEKLVNGVTKISILKAKNKTVQESETIRKMLFAMIKDIRVILIKLADKLHNMRTLEHLSEHRRRAIAQECLDVYAPLAGRLGISWLKAELEDLSLKHLHFDVYQQVKQFISEKRSAREEYLKRVKEDIYRAAGKEGIQVQVKTRMKHFYSVYAKMRRRGKQLDEIYDLLGIRILCNTQGECYTLLGLIHQLWIPISGRFKDYIAMPKANGYMSLHTTVMCYDGKRLEIQIRTHEMNKTAEYGIAAHWLYKKGFNKENLKVEDLHIVNKLKNWDGVKITSSQFLEEIKRELLKDSIYVFTPRGQVVELPKGATPIDFAYHIHTEIGDHCLIAKADGAIVPLRSELNNTQVVEIITSPQAHPHVNWLRYVKTSRARSKVRNWLNKHDENLIIDRNIVAKKQAASKHDHHEENHKKPEKKPQEEVPNKYLDKKKVGIKIGNERNMMIRFAKCCEPAVGDDIIGYISRGRGIIVHRRDCPNLKYIKDFTQRRMEVEWETVSPKATRRFRVTARQTSNLFSEIEGSVRKYHGHLIEYKLEENEQGRLIGFFTMELDKKEDFKKVVKSIRTIPHVLTIEKINE